jgi:hypothetical protein
MKTVIDEIIEASDFFSIIDFKKWFNEEKGRLKEKEKEQINKAWIHGAVRSPLELKHINNAKGYYDSTFGDNHEAGI